MRHDAGGLLRFSCTLSEPWGLTLFRSYETERHKVICLKTSAMYGKEHGQSQQVQDPSSSSCPVGGFVRSVDDLIFTPSDFAPKASQWHNRACRLRLWISKAYWDTYVACWSSAQSEQGGLLSQMRVSNLRPATSSLPACRACQPVCLHRECCRT